MDNKDIRRLKKWMSKNLKTGKSNVEIRELKRSKKSSEFSFKVIQKDKKPKSKKKKRLKRKGKKPKLSRVHPISEVKSYFNIFLKDFVNSHFYRFEQIESRNLTKTA